MTKPPQPPSTARSIGAGLGLRPYSDRPARLLTQICVDVVVLVWMVWWWRTGGTVRDTVLKLSAPGSQIDSGATGVADNLREAGGQVGRVPGVGDDLAGPFDRAGDAADAIARAGQLQVAAVADVATLLGWVVAAVPILLALLLWLPPRWRFARRAAATTALLHSDQDLRLFALRALTRQPVQLVARIDADPLGAWQRGDAAVIAALADLELREAGVRAR